MGLVNIDVSNPEELYQQRRLIPNGKYRFEIAKELVVTPCNEPSSNDKVEIELRCLDDGAVKGAVVFDRIILVPAENTSPKAITTKRINNAKLAQLTLAAGVMTKAQIAESGGQIPLDAFKGQVVEVAIRTAPAQGGYEAKNEVSRYLFQTEEPIT